MRTRARCRRGEEGEKAKEGEEAEEEEEAALDVNFLELSEKEWGALKVSALTVERYVMVEVDGATVCYAPHDADDMHEKRCAMR